MLRQAKAKAEEKKRIERLGERKDEKGKRKRRKEKKVSNENGKGEASFSATVYVTTSTQIKSLSNMDQTLRIS